VVAQAHCPSTRSQVCKKVSSTPSDPKPPAGRPLSALPLNPQTRDLFAGAHGVVQHREET